MDWMRLLNPANGPLVIGAENQVRMRSRRVFNMRATVLISASQLRIAHAYQESTKALPPTVATYRNQAYPKNPTADRNIAVTKSDGCPPHQRGWKRDVSEFEV